MRDKQKSALAAAVMATAALGGVAWSAPVTGWNRDAAGTYDYSSPGNWVGGTAADINGIWDPTLALLGAQSVTFSSDTSLGSGLSFGYAGAYNETLLSDGLADHTLTLGGDVLVNTASANRTITFGSATANQKLAVNLGGATRTFEVRGTAGTNNQRSLSFVNGLSNGSAAFGGGGNVNLNNPGSLLTYSLSGLTVKNAVVSLSNNKTAVSLSGALTIDGAGLTNASGNTGGIGYLSLGSGASLTAASLSRAHGGVVVMRGTSLGAGSTAIKFTTAPSLVGGGGLAGTTNISIVPWILGGTSTSTNETFVTYDSTNGIRPLDPTTEFVNYASGYSGAISGTDNNVKVADGGSVEFTGSNTVNSLSVNYNGSASTASAISGGTITVTSGAVSLVSRQGVTVSANLAFGTAQGVVGYTQGKPTSITGAISGSAGLVLYQSAPHAASGSGGTGIAFSGGATGSSYTGDTYILGRANFAAGVLPSGSRTGDVYVSGIFETNGDTINGLNGSGLLSKANTGAGTLTIGDNNASGIFTGAINGNLTLTKTGSGTQVLGGAGGYTGATVVNGGVLKIDSSGSITGTSGIQINGGELKYNSSTALTAPVTFTSGRLGGTGAINTAVSVGSNATLAPGNSPGAQDYAAGLTFAGGGTYQWEINDATGSQGSNWDLVTVSGGAFAISADSGNPFTIDITGLKADNSQGVVPDFNKDLSYKWLLLDANSAIGDFAADKFALLTSHFDTNNPLNGSFALHRGDEAGIGGDSSQLYVTYTAIPEPTTLALAGVAGAAIMSMRRRRA